MAGAEPLSEIGHGPRGPVAALCLHGLTSTPQSIAPIATALADRGHAVSAPRLPGHGRSSWRAMQHTRYEDWVTHAESQLIQLSRQHESVVVVGLSLGGAIATDLADRRPELVSGLVLINPAFAASDPRLTVLPVLQYLLPYTAGLAGDVRRADAPEELAYPVLPLRAFASFVRRWPALLQAAQRLRCPVLLARSAHDAVVPTLSAERFLQKVQPSLVQQLHLPNSAHVATLDHDAPALIEAIVAFVEETTG